MAKSVYHRLDLQVQIAGSGLGDQHIRLFIRDQRAQPTTRLVGEERLPASLVEQWTTLRPQEIVSGLEQLNALTQGLEAFEDFLGRHRCSGPCYFRLVLSFPGIPEWNRLSWEPSLYPLVRAYLPRRSVNIIRESMVIPRVRAAPFTLPLRLFQLAPDADSNIRRVIRDMLAPELGTEKSGYEIQDIVDFGYKQWADLTPWVRMTDWQALDVLHIDDYPLLDRPDELMSIAATDTPGTLGWLSRTADTLQIRLIIIHCPLDKPERVGLARQLAQAITDRGGPAVIVSFLTKDAARSFFKQFYEDLIHDFPLDHDVHPWPIHFHDAIEHVSLFAGVGRSELIRLSAPGAELAQFNASDLIEQIITARRLSWYDERALRDKEEELKKILASIRSGWESEWTFHGGERKGLVPLSKRLQEIRRTVGGGGGLHFLEREEEKVVIGGASPAASRFVNAGLWEGVATLQPRELLQAGARLEVGQLYALSIQIGARNVRVKTLGATAVVEEVFKWTPEMKGAWVEVGVTGMDFQVIGAAQQELWLPARGDSEPVYFSVVPQASGAAVLQFSLYYRQNLIQSFELGAVAYRKGQPERPYEEETKDLARALGISETETAGLGYLPVLKYSLTNAADNPPEQAERRFNILANERDGQTVLTIKGRDLFNPDLQSNLTATHVEGVRDSLDLISNPMKSEEPAYWVYAFGKDNTGDPEKLRKGLRQLAERGWALYSALIPDHGAKEQVNALLREPGQIIHVAHVFLEKVIPWAAIYTRKYDAGKSIDDAGAPVAHDVCLACLPDHDGQLGCVSCGQHSDCLLHPDQIRARAAAGRPAVTPETVVCPLHFWGFKHIIEIPPFQVEHSKAPDGKLRDTIHASSRPQVAVGMNTGGLRLAHRHLEALEEQLFTGPAAKAALRSKAFNRDLLLRDLRDTSLDIIYLYCHAAAGAVDPVLEFQEKEGSPVGTISPSQLDDSTQWGHYPLVILNGCETASYRPDALSPFIKTLVRGRGASGVIGTEITVWEPLAGEAALQFLQHFLGGATAGEALLRVRRSLLAKNNPLGLVYTLYSLADLRLK